MALIHPIAAAASLGILEPQLRRDLVQSIRTASRSRTVFPVPGSPLTVFRHAVSEAITSIEARGELLTRFLKEGPYEGDGPLPRHLRGKRLTDEECGRAITFVYSHMVNAFQGRLAELLALGVTTTLVNDWKQDRLIERNAHVYVGDAAQPTSVARSGRLKGADLHVMTVRHGNDRPVFLAAVGEVKSFPCSLSRLDRQLDQHVTRARRGISIISQTQPRTRNRRTVQGAAPVLRFSIVPSSWHLSRNFRFVEKEGRTFLDTDRREPPPKPTIERLSRTRWHGTLRWSREALAEAAYELTFWYMEKLGEVIYREKGSSPWPEMTPAEAGRNAAKMMLYYAIRRCKRERDEGRAIALYNTYGFGYSLGANFRTPEGKREMLWPEDLREILAQGKAKNGATIWK